MIGDVQLSIRTRDGKEISLDQLRAMRARIDALIQILESAVAVSRSDPAAPIPAPVSSTPSPRSKTRSKPPGSGSASSDSISEPPSPVSVKGGSIRCETCGAPMGSPAGYAQHRKFKHPLRIDDGEEVGRAPREAGGAAG